MPTWIVRFEFETEIEAPNEEEAVSIAQRALSEVGFSVSCERKIEHHELHTDIGPYDESIMRRLRGGN
jgi:hypothetical protein